jgi:hypothetical protein
MLVAEKCAGWKNTDLVGLLITRLGNQQPRRVINNPTKSVFFQPAHFSATNIEWLLPEVVFKHFVSPDDEHCVLETCREL